MRNGKEDVCVRDRLGLENFVTWVLIGCNARGLEDMGLLPFMKVNVGGEGQCKSYRGISLLKVVEKIYAGS